MFKKINKYIILPIYRFWYWKIQYNVGPKGLKHLYQRMKYGFSDRDCWSGAFLPNFLASYINKIKVFSAQDNHPVEEIRKLNIMQTAFLIEKDIACLQALEYISKEQKEDLEKYLKKNPKHTENMHILTQDEMDLKEKGWDYFKKYFNTLFT